MGKVNATGLVVGLIGALSFAGMLGCDSEASTASDDGTSVTEDPLFTCDEKEFKVAAPLHGPNYDQSKGGLQGDTQGSYVVSTTVLYLKTGVKTDFFKVATQVTGQVDKAPGMVAWGLASDDGCGSQRTLVVWESEEAMYDFVRSGAHAEHMGDFDTFAINGKTSVWTATADEVNKLDFDVAKEHLKAEDPINDENNPDTGK
jgi:heme-degrading monooxygenase HmoA